MHTQLRGTSMWALSTCANAGVAAPPATIMDPQLQAAQPPALASQLSNAAEMTGSTSTGTTTTPTLSASMMLSPHALCGRRSSSQTRIPSSLVRSAIRPAIWRGSCTRASSTRINASAIMRYMAARRRASIRRHVLEMRVRCVEA